tara:strand:- start:18 stop:1301 length:1284 start_codon:yes stop_codon:yes gene_type:complete
MPLKKPEKSLATKDSNSIELYENRKVYKDKALMAESAGNANTNNYIIPGVAEFWYDRYLYGKVNREGDIIILRENFLKTLKTNSKETLYTLNFVALAFGEMKDYIEHAAASNKIPNKRTLFATINPVNAWQSIYDEYHQYMSDVYRIFFDFLIDQGREEKINNFDDFAREFFLFCRNMVAGSARSPVTLSGFMTNSTVDGKCGGLTIDLYRARASNDPTKTDTFIKDVNFEFYKHAATKHGFVIDKNVPWRLTANLKSKYMKLLMESPAFDLTYSLGPRHIFDAYFLKTYTLDLIFLRKYMYDMYNSLLIGAPFYTKYKYCNNTQKTKKIIFERALLTTAKKENIYTVRDYWISQIYRFRLLELKHDLTEKDISQHIEEAKSIYDIRGKIHALKFLHNKTKIFFLDSYNKLNANLKLNTPQHPPKIT